jgi:hypothetical protein
VVEAAGYNIRCLCWCLPSTIIPILRHRGAGGTPVAVTIYFTKDSVISPNKTASAQLIEEPDEGSYIVGPKETRAIFVPRSAVALVYFSDKVTGSPLLRDSK